MSNFFKRIYAFTSSFIIERNLEFKKQETNLPNLIDKYKEELKVILELKDINVITIERFEERKKEILSKYGLTIRIKETIR
jgi:hypothetical protein